MFDVYVKIGTASNNISELMSNNHRIQRFRNTDLLMLFMEITLFNYENHANTQVHSVDKTTYALMVQLVVLMVTCVS